MDHLCTARMLAALDRMDQELRQCIDVVEQLRTKSVEDIHDVWRHLNNDTL